MNRHRILGRKLVASAGTDDLATFFEFKELLGIAAGGMPNDGTLPSDPATLGGFRLAQACLFELRRGRKNLREDGILYRGRPDFITDEVLRGLQAEMEAQQPTAMRDRWQQHLAPAGPKVQAIVDHPGLRQLVTELVGPVLPRPDATCLFYDHAGAEIRPHVDVDQFCVNANLMIAQSGETCSSDFVLYPVEGDPQRLRFLPGELLIFYADCIVHARTPIAEGEKVRAVSIGFRPENELHFDEICPKEMRA